LRLLFVVVAVLALAGCGSTADVPRQEDAVTQYDYARATWYDPAFDVQGSARQERLRQAVDGFQAVVRYFPDDAQAVTTRALAEYYTGLCRLQLGETERARAAFMRCRDAQRQATDASLHPAARATLRTILDQAREQIRRLDDVKVPQ